MYYLRESGVIVVRKMSDEEYEAMSYVEKCEVRSPFSIINFYAEFGFYPRNFLVKDEA